MAQLFKPRDVQQRQPALAPVLAADVGGTHARVGLVTPAVSGSSALDLTRYQKYVCADYPSLAAILRDFLAQHADAGVARGAIACAGYLLDGSVINANLPWPVSLAGIRRELALEHLVLVNDFTAVAHATALVPESDLTLLAPTQGEPIIAPTLVVGPGTGLGAAVRVPHDRGCTILSTEAGQAAFAASAGIEMEILALLQRKSAHVSIETVLSGPGLVNLHAALRELRGAPPVPRTPAEISAAALAADDPLARETLQIFCGLMGSIVGDLVLLYGAQGGVCLAGGILPQIRDFLLRSTFIERFRNKGQMRGLLERVPVWLIEHGQLGVLGAAQWYLQHPG